MSGQRRAILHGDSEADLAEQLHQRGWTVGDATAVDVVVVKVCPLPVGSGWQPAQAMEIVADTIETIAGAREVLEERGGLAVVVVSDPPERALTAHPAGGVVAAALTTAVHLLAADWARTGAARCLLAVSSDADSERLAALVSWLTDTAAPPLTGQVIDLHAAEHVVLPQASPGLGGGVAGTADGDVS